MKKIIKKLSRFVFLQMNGFMPVASCLKIFFKDLNFFKAPFVFWRDYFTYRQKNSDSKKFNTKLLDVYPILYDRYNEAGYMPRHYFHQDIWAAKKVYESGVKKHYDIGSRLDGFIAHCLPFCEIIMLDIRPLSKEILNLKFIKTDCTNMANINSGYITSISSLHAIEHFGLGRYGDNIDPDGYKRVINEIQRVVQVGGNIYLSVPIGRERLEFNAHRIFDPHTILDLFKNCELKEFSAVNDANEFIKNARTEDFQSADYSCGLFHFVKK